MWTVLQRLLASDSDRDVVDSAADALLPLILAFPRAFQRLGERYPNFRSRSILPIWLSAQMRGMKLNMTAPAEPAVVRTTDPSLLRVQKATICEIGTGQPSHDAAWLINLISTLSYCWMHDVRWQVSCPQGAQ